MKRFRILTNGQQFRVQIKGFFGWRYLTETNEYSEIMGPQYDSIVTLKTEGECEEYIKKEYGRHFTIDDHQWKAI